MTGTAFAAHVGVFAAHAREFAIHAREFAAHARGLAVDLRLTSQQGAGFLRGGGVGVQMLQPLRQRLT
ncbi:hypothetical protein, partial [Amycolatopsis cihanbeyliensis]